MNINYSLNYNDDNVERKGYIDKQFILQYLSEEDIYELVFGFKPVEYQYVCSPFRADNSPGAFFERYETDGKLWFIDWGDPIKVSNDCFNCVQRYYNLSNFYQTLNFIKHNFIDNKNLKKKSIDLKEKKIIEKKKTEILFRSRYFIEQDKLFWSRYKISKQNLIDDGVFPVAKYSIKNSKKGDFSAVAYTPCYAYTDFENGKKKLYFPYKINKKFLTTCGKNDIGGLKFLFDSPQLIITKSYKDYRVLKNKGLNVIWFQNEGMFPIDAILLPLVNKYSEVIIFYDNDSTGIAASLILSNHINSFYPNKSRSLHLPIELLEKGITDPSDMIYKVGEKELDKFLKNNNIL